MSSCKHTLFLLSLSMLPLFGNSIEHEFQDYRFVLNEFNLDDNFAKNPEFKQFVEENKEFYKKNYSKAIQERFFIADELQTQLAINDASPILMYISFTESSLNSTLVSRSGAGGLWQFMPPTARGLGLRVDSDIDERTNTKLATQAAVEYLTKMNKDFNKWYLSAMAYNCGENKMKKAIAQAGTDDINVLLSENNNYLPDETKKYLKKILLYAMIGENHLFVEN